MNWRPVVWSLVAGTFLSRIGTYMTMPFLAIYLHQVAGMEAGWVGTVIGVSFLVGMFSSFLGGVWSDRFGRYPIMLISLLGWSATFVGFAMVQTWLGFFLVSACNGFFRNLFEPTSKALIGDIAPPEKLMHVFRARYLAINAGAALGPLAGVYLGSAHTTGPFWVTAGICLSYLLLLVVVSIRFPATAVWTKSRQSVTFRKAWQAAAIDRAFRSYLLGSSFVYAAYAQMESTLAQYMANAPGITDGIQLYSWLVLTNTIAVLSLQAPVMRLFRRKPPIVALQAGALLLGAGLFGFGAFPSWIGLVLSMVVFSVGELLCFVTGEIVVQELAPSELRGTYFGASGLAFIGQGVGPWLGGFLLETLGFSRGLLVFALLMLTAWCAVPLFMRAQIWQQQSQKAGL